MLTAEQKAALKAAAEREGVDAAELLAAAEQETGGAEKPAPSSRAAKGEAARADGRPVADRLLVGFLPFIKVKELRAIWLGLTDSIPDDELTCGEYAAKHGGAVGGSSPTPGESGG